MSDFGDIIDDMDTFYKKLTEKMFKQIEEIDKSVKSGRLQGDWEIKPIEEPGVKGYIAQGRFYSNNSQNALPKPIKLPKRPEEENREPLTDVFEENDKIKIYMELPGVDKNDIHLNVTDRNVEVKARNFYKTVTLPECSLSLDKVSAKYKNGVLEVTVPKRKTQANRKKHAIKIE